MYKSMGDLAISVEEYISFFNSYRPHRKLKMKTPNQVENKYFLSAVK
ncbi:MAG: IS3 family transposase [Clostridiales bacterium]|nr:IS3 family transposase [Clostridiales bacterium]